MGGAPLSFAELAGRSLSEVRSIGPKGEAALRSVGIEQVLDLLTTYPRRWVDRTNEARIADLALGQPSLVVATVHAVAGRRTRQGRSMVTAEVRDGTGRMSVTFFNQPWRERQLTSGLTVALFGRPELFRGRLQMTSPTVDVLGDADDRPMPIVPIYPQSEKSGLTSRQLQRWIAAVLDKCRPRGLLDPVPAEVRRALGLVDRHTAFEHIHRPETKAQRDAARTRLVFDELLRVQLLLVLRKLALEQGAVGIRHRVDGPLVRRFHERLPYALTGAQRRVIAEIAADLAAATPMHRLLQGDVGAGKTVVAVTALLTAVEGGHQGALMAPTEVLAEQHHAGVRHLLDGLTVPSEGTLLPDRPLRVELLTNRTTAAERRRILAGLADGTVDLLIGTHALIQEKVRFASLGVVVIDEQHRFGVEQRAALRAKADEGGQGTVPDVLVMTATPIPRTAAMTVYGDLDVSVLDELPPGRTPIVTRWAQGPLAEQEVWQAVRDEVAAGHQAYVVCPLVEESDKLEVASAEQTFERLARGELAGLRLGLLHGRVPARDKEAVMAAFRAGELDVLVATTVIEVGVDVPNATAMVILDADRFGIAQLHQLRGRVGRGAAESRCWLLSTPNDEAAVEGNPRLEALVATTNGFELAEIDLELRGEGTIMNAAQSGRSDLKLASLRRDRDLVVAAREAAFRIVTADPGLAGNEALRQELQVVFAGSDIEFLFKS